MPASSVAREERGHEEHWKCHTESGDAGFSWDSEDVLLLHVHNIYHVHV